MHIEKKIWPEFFEAFHSDARKADLRLNDFEVNPGDTLVLREWNPDTKEYTGREVLRTVSHIHHFTHADLERFHSIESILEKGLQVISFE